ncbi:hypothetical protein CC85DRAFT_323508 [Cutaneotrichosporon oleaginosum]|uniref:DUF92-domain-containing protein n=1 Tax=Cutaneotrichosporon oleaginosum TaxID=879819 RepID=A0A0J1BA76_9TREE|nr:uncharacterized protein CC85DRAFT_323508 [Cutaneotrichosporon oleaginosum]KLT44809.1 hypothetical protein CC85DRAFT_323508 [Cutaneotrichosporon oleaginosum]TXT11948.1 hypothetical protein COLE_02358 [Cutaneotrichosporon oleaginosum]
MTNLYPGAALIATGLAAHGYRKGALSASGATAAWVAGYAHLANPLKLFGVTMIVFYLAGSRATKAKAAIKATLEDGPDGTSGNRTWVQVLSNSLPGVLVALSYRLTYDTYPPAPPNLPPTLLAGLPRRLIFALVGHYATCLADTLASELGILAGRPTHIVTRRPVPAGTNGGVTARGLAWSLVGGLVMGLTVAAGVVVEDPSAYFAPSKDGVRAAALWVALSGWRGPVGLVVFGAIAGVAGSLLDSILGGTLQRTLYSTADGRVLTDHSDPARARAPGVVTIGPGIDVLSNSAVNAICGAVMAAFGWWVAGW